MPDVPVRGLVGIEQHVMKKNLPQSALNCINAGTYNNIQNNCKQTIPPNSKVSRTPTLLTWRSPRKKLLFDTMQGFLKQVVPLCVLLGR